MKGWICCFCFHDYKDEQYYYKIDHEIIYASHIYNIINNRIHMYNNIINNGIRMYNNELIFKNKEDIHKLLQHDIDVYCGNIDYKIYINKIYVKNYKIIDDYYNLDGDIFTLEILEGGKIKFPTIRPLDNEIFVYPKERL